MRTRTSWRNQDRLFRELFKPVPDTAREETKPWLRMTDAEIDKEYWHWSKADRTRIKKEAAQERLREHVRAVLANGQGGS